MSNASDFEIRNGYLEKYLGNDETVVIPEEVRWVCHSAFDNQNIKKIVFGDNVSTIDAYAFYKSKNIEAYDISANNPCFCSVDGIIFSKDMKKVVAFPTGRGGAYTVVEGVEEIDFGAFYQNTGLSEVHFPETLSVIGLTAFSGCDGMKSVHIPKNVVKMDCSSTFGSNMESITVDPGNKEYASFDGMVFSGKFKTIKYCPPKKKGEVILPETVSGINAGAFQGCSQITKIEIPEKVSKIGWSAFNNCSGLKEISLPGKITTVAEAAFEDCKNLLKVSFPNELIAIEGRAFSGCDSLQEIVLPPHVTKLGADAFSANTAVFCPSEIFKKLPTPTKETTCVKYLEESERFSEKLAKVIVAYIKKNKSIFFETLIKEGNVSAFQNCLALFKMTKAMTDECLELSSRYNRPEMNFVLLDSGNKKAEQPAKKEKINDNKEVIADDSGKFVLSSKEAKKLFRFSETPDGAIINGYKGNETKIVIPDQIGDYPVVGIKKGAFACNATIEEVYLPDSIQKIESAFGNCPNLTKLNLPASLVEIGRAAFENCPKLQKTEIPGSLKKIGDQAFRDCPSFADENGFVIVGDVLFGYYGTEERIIVPDGVKTIASFAFEETIVAKEIMFPKSVKKLEHDVFRGCLNLERIYASKGITSINWAAISWVVIEKCPNLTIHAPAGSRLETYAKENNILFVAE